MKSIFPSQFEKLKSMGVFPNFAPLNALDAVHTPHTHLERPWPLKIYFLRKLLVNLLY